MMERAWLNNVQATLNDAHMIVTDKVRAIDARAFTADEETLLTRIDAAIMHCQSMRTADKQQQRPLRVRP